jgi:hypothetical protein
LQSVALGHLATAPGRAVRASFSGLQRQHTPVNRSDSHPGMTQNRQNRLGNTMTGMTATRGALTRFAGTAPNAIAARRLRQAAARAARDAGGMPRPCRWISCRSLSERRALPGLGRQAAQHCSLGRERDLLHNPREQRMTECPKPRRVGAPGGCCAASGRGQSRTRKGFRRWWSVVMSASGFRPLMRITTTILARSAKPPARPCRSQPDRQPLAADLVEQNAGRDRCVERFDLPHLRDADQIVADLSQWLAHAGGFVADDDR